MRRNTARLTVALPAVAVLASLTLASCGNDKADAPKGGLQLAKDGSLTVCTAYPYKPFEELQGDKPVGFDVDIVEEFAKSLNVKSVWVDTPFEGIQSGQDLTNKKCDVAAAAITITDERKNSMLFTDPYFSATQVLLVKKGANIASENDLAGKKLGVQSGTTGAKYAEEKLNKATVVQFEDVAAEAQAVKTGAIDAAINDNGPLLNFAKDNADTEVTKKFDTGEKYGFAMAKDNTALKAKLDETLAAMKKDGRMDKLSEQYFGEKVGS